MAATALLGLTPAQATGTEIGGQGNEFHFQDSPEGGETAMFYGRTADRAIVGDWDGDGIDTIAVRRERTYYFSNNFRGGPAENVVDYGRPDDEVLVGDWDGDGLSTLGVRRGNMYYLKNDLGPGPADVVVGFGRPSDIAVVGDWNGDGIDTLAVRREDTFYLSNSFTGGEADLMIGLGYHTDTPISGDWDGDGRTDVGVRRGSVTVTQTQRQLSRGSFTTQSYGQWSDRIVVGDWNGDGVDTLGLRRPPTINGKVQAPAESHPRQIMIEQARTRIGISRYVFAATGPTEFDCSGLTSWAYRHIGVTLPRASTQQRDFGTVIPAEEALPGDLIWWPGHVAIYTGEDRMIDAANPEIGISERRIMRNPTFIRILPE